MRGYPVKKNLIGSVVSGILWYKQTNRFCYFIIRIYIHIYLEIIKAACHGNGSIKVIKELLDAGANIEERSLSDLDSQLGKNYKKKL